MHHVMAAAFCHVVTHSIQENKDKKQSTQQREQNWRTDKYRGGNKQVIE
jgi:hypothetical protein